MSEGKPAQIRCTVKNRIRLSRGEDSSGVNFVREEIKEVFTQGDTLDKSVC